MRITNNTSFNVGTSMMFLLLLNDRLKGIRMEYLPQTFWSQRDKVNARAMIQAIDKRLKTRGSCGVWRDLSVEDHTGLLVATSKAGNPVKKILLKLNLSDHRILKDGGGGT
ncbi:hypothetical protein Tco_1324269 [Tanacetum coccineum]